MARVKVRQEISVYEIDDEDVSSGDIDIIGVDSHWNRDDFVVLRIGDKTYTVVGDDLKVAIENAENSGGI